MDNNVQNPNSKLTFCQIAAWFSFFTPIACAFLGCAFIVLTSVFPLMDHFADKTQTLIHEWIFHIMIIVQIISLISGIFGLFAKNIYEKVLALSGMLVACVVGFVTILVAILMAILTSRGSWESC